ncbi:MAG: tetratricopeptide repeat protein [Candidatus Daviesbacteria bacterium]|nr:tetratricopeptide repeat protein [Candidatus Daviesbacteria bacterium]
MANLFNRIIKTSIYLLVFLMPLFFLPFSSEFFEFNKHYLLFFLVSLAFFSWLAKMVLVDKEIRFKRSLLDIPILAFLAVAILSAIFSIDKNSSLFGFYGRFSDGLIVLISLAALYFLITNNAAVSFKTQNLKFKTANKNSKAETNGPVLKEPVLTSPAIISVRGITVAFNWSVLFVVLVSYFSVFGVWEKLNSLFAGQFPQFLLVRIFNPVAGSLEGLAIFLAVFLVFLSSRYVIGIKGKLETIFTGLLIPAILLLLMVIGFKAAWLAVFLSSVLFVGFALWKRMFRENVNRLLLPIFLIVIAVLFMFTSGAISIRSVVSLPILPQEQVLNQSQSLTIGAKAATGNVKNLFLGSGIGTFYYDFSRFKTTSFNQSALWAIRFDRPGNHIAEVLGTMGVLGILSYLFLIGLFLMAAYFVLEKSKQNMPYAMMFLALLISQFVFYQTTLLAFLFWLLLAISVVNWQKQPSEKIMSFKDFPELSLVFSVILTVLGIFLAIGYFFSARFYLADMNYRKAITQGDIKSLEKAVALNPYESQYKIVLSRAYFGQVLAELQKPVEERDQVALSANVYLSLTYLKGGAIGARTIKGATEVVPNRVAAWETLGIIYRDIQSIASGSLDWAIKSFEKSVALEPANPILHTELGKLYVTANKIDEAKKEFEKAKTLKPDYIDSSVQLVGIYENEKNLDEAIRQMEGLAALYPQSVDIMFQLGRLYYNNKRADDAAVQFQKVIALMPGHSNAHFSLGVIYQSKGDNENAIKEFKIVLELNPGNQDVQARINQLRGSE